MDRRQDFVFTFPKPSTLHFLFPENPFEPLKEGERVKAHYSYQLWENSQWQSLGQGEIGGNEKIALGCPSTSKHTSGLARLARNSRFWWAALISYSWGLVAPA